MKSFKIAGVVVAAVLALGVTACSQQTPSTPVSSSASEVVAPVVLSADDLQGATVDLSVGQVLDITTGDLAVDSYSAEVEDPSVVEFVEGRESGGATFNPGLTALTVGTTKVTLSNEDGGIEDVIFTVSVTEPGSR